METPKRYGGMMHPAGMRSDWELYRSNITAADTDPEVIDTPANTSNTYHQAASKPANPIVFTPGSTRLHLRAATSANISLSGVLVLWDSGGHAGDPITVTLTATGRKDAGGKYLTAKKTVDIGPNTYGHLFLTSLPSGSIDRVEVRMD